MMRFRNNKGKVPLLLSEIEKKELQFTPLCELFDEAHKLYSPGSRTVSIDFAPKKVENHHKTNRIS